MMEWCYDRSLLIAPSAWPMLVNFLLVELLFGVPLSPLGLFAGQDKHHRCSTTVYHPASSVTLLVRSLEVILDS